MAQKYALVVGCNYPNTKYELSGCINDAKSMHNVLLERFKFEETNTKLVIEDKPDSENKPTASTIKAILKQFLSGAKHEDVVFFSFSGHGLIIPGNMSSSGEDEQAIVACDTLITSMEFREILHGAPDGVSFDIMSDSCHSGKLIDKETEQIGPNHNPTTIERVVSSTEKPRMITFDAFVQQLSLQIDTLNDVQANITQLFGLDASVSVSNDQLKEPLKANQGILLSACQADELSYETVFDVVIHGAFTWAVLNVLKEIPDPITNWKIVLRARQFLEKAGKKQHPASTAVTRMLMRFSSARSSKLYKLSPIIITLCYE